MWISRVTVKSVWPHRSVSGSASYCSGIGTRNALDHLDHLLGSIPLVLGEGDEFLDFAQHFTLLRRAHDGDSPAATKLQKPFVTKNMHGPKHGVLVHAKDSCDVFDQWEPITRSGLAFRYGATYVGSHLIVQRDRTGSVHLH